MAPTSGDLSKVETRFSPKVLREVMEWAIGVILFLSASFSVFMTFAILALLVTESAHFFEQVPLTEFLTDTQWTPLFGEKHYGIIVLLSGTAVTSVVALVVALPIGTTIAIYLSEFASKSVREVAKPILELLAGVPTVVYGYFALLFVTPLLQRLIPGLGIFNMLSAGIVMGIMIVPYVSSICEDAMSAVPASLKEGSYAMGATRFQTAVWTVFPAALSGISAAYILGVSRAVGETMIVAVASGLQPQLVWNPLDQGATVTAYIVQVSLGDLPHGTLEYQTIFAAGLTLVLMTLVLNVLGHVLTKRYRESY